jgi:isopentenyl-diphosphate Delta-isomerase
MMTATEYVVLVDTNDRETGQAEKMAAHQQGLLHRAFSIFIFDHKRITPETKLLLQQRALGKYHSAGLWTNTCCSHPRSGEDMLVAGKRRLQEELGFTTDLHDKGFFHYTAHFENGLCENEIDHVLVGTISETTVIVPNPEEVATLRWISLSDLSVELENHPELFTPWLKQALQLL